MAARFCSSCGQSIPPGATTCPACGASIPGAPLPASVYGGMAPMPVAQPWPGPAPPPAAGAPPPPPPLSWSPSEAPSLSSVLGLMGMREFLIQREFPAVRATFRVMNREKLTLFKVHANQSQDFRALLRGNMTQTYSLRDLQGGELGTFTETFGHTWSERGSAEFTLTDAAGRACVVITIHRGMTGKITAAGTFPDGRPMMRVEGNLIHHNFLIQDPAGLDLAKVHEDWVSVQDTYGLEIVGTIDPLYPIALTILLDLEKEPRGGAGPTVTIR